MADSSVPITAGSGTPIRVLTGLGTGSADQQVMTLADSAGNLLGTTAAPVPMGRYDTTVTGSITAAAQTVTVATVNGGGIVGVQLTGTWTATLTFEASIDGATFVAVRAADINGAGATSTSFNGLYRIGSGGYVSVRVRAGAFTSGTVAVTLVSSAATTAVALAEPLPAGGNTIGAITGSGTAGTPATGVQTVQGITGGFALPVSSPASTLMVSTTAAITTALTATLPAAGAGLFHYITSVSIKRYAGAALPGAAAPTVVTTTNLPGSLAFSFDTAGAIGTSEVQQFSFAADPLKSSAANTATTVVAPGTTSVIWRINVAYYTAT